MKSKIKLILVLFFLFFTARAFAEISIKAEVDKVSITADDTLIYKLIITTSEKEAPVLVMPKFVGFDIVSQAQSSTITFAKGGSNSNLVYVFILAPRGTGKFTLQPFTVEAGPKKYTSQQFEIEVTQGSPKLQIPTQPQSPQPGSTEPQTTL